MSLSRSDSFLTAGGVVIRCKESVVAPEALDELSAALDARRGLLLACGCDVPGRYARSDVGFVDPPLVVTACGRRVRVQALNARGGVLLPAVRRALDAQLTLTVSRNGADELIADVAPARAAFSEEDRLREPSVYTALRALLGLFTLPTEHRLGLYGAFGYDLAFGVEPIVMRHERSAAARSLVLYLPDELLVYDRRRELCTRLEYDFVVDWASTDGLPRTGVSAPFVPSASSTRRDHAPGEYAAVVRRAQRAFAAGDLFEVVPSQCFIEPCAVPPSVLSQRLRAENPAPYEFLANLGEGEWLVGASPEMYVRVTGTRVESCPIAGTVARGPDPLADAAAIRTLLTSEKDEAELTMCTDVDRNDKARVCEPGSVRVIGRRLIEMYSRLIHTADHVEGRLRPTCDALDAFMAHAWAVTVTGAPKLAAMQFIEDHERSPRSYYGGAIGVLRFDGSLDSGLVLRTAHLRDGRAEVRVGATLLADSDPEAEERETELKASAVLAALREAPRGSLSMTRDAAGSTVSGVGQGRRVLLVDHRDSFVHSLAAYFRQTGAQVETRRADGNGVSASVFEEVRPDLVVLSPGPGRPDELGVGSTLARAQERGTPVFGVCLGLQGLVQFFGGTLETLPVPMHGKASRVRSRGGRLLQGLPPEFRAGRYHSLCARPAGMPRDLQVTAISDDGVVMAVEHRVQPLAAVQFHPESIMSVDDGVGLRIVANAMAMVTWTRAPDGGRQ